MRPILLTLAIVMGFACTGSKPEPRDQAVETAGIPSLPPAATALVTADTITVELPLALPTQLYVEHDAEIYARSSGIVQAILADLGAESPPASCWRAWRTPIRRSR